MAKVPLYKEREYQIRMHHLLKGVSYRVVWNIFGRSYGLCEGPTVKARFWMMRCGGIAKSVRCAQQCRAVLCLCVLELFNESKGLNNPFLKISGDYIGMIGSHDGPVKTFQHDVRGVRLAV